MRLVGHACVRVIRGDARLRCRSDHGELHLNLRVLRWGGETRGGDLRVRVSPSESVGELPEQGGELKTLLEPSG